MEKLINLISSLGESDFKKLVVAVIKKKFKTSSVRIVDGPNDGGNDVEIIVNGETFKRTIQVTVLKNDLSSKINSNLVDASDNASKYDYLREMDFFCSQNISNEKKNELVRLAREKYDIKLLVYDSKYIAQYALEHLEIKSLIYELHNLPSQFVENIDKQTKILFDVLTLNKNSVEIKKNFLNSYIESFLYSHQDATFSEIMSYLTKCLVGEKIDKNFLFKVLNDLRLNHTLISPQSDKSKYHLSEENRSQLHDIFMQVEKQEKDLLCSVESFIISHNIKCDGKNLTEYLYELYNANYAIDVEEIKSNENSFSSSLKRTFNDLVTYFTKCNIDSSNATVYANELIGICNSNEFLAKIATTRLFTNLYVSDKLEKYINNKKQIIFLDTQILLRILCVISVAKTMVFEDPALRSVRLLLDIFTTYKSKISLFSSYDYVKEVVGHVLEAVKIYRLLALPFMSTFGSSSNVLYNFYKNLEKNNEIGDDESFIDFLNNIIDLGTENLDGIEDSKYVDCIENAIIRILTQSGITLIYHKQSSYFQAAVEIYENSLLRAEKNRTIPAINNDVRTALYLSDKEIYRDAETGTYNEPFLLTWDNLFYAFRKDLLSHYKERGYWYIYTPAKMAERISVMNFNMVPQTISLNIIALTETNFNGSSKNMFLDVISSFFNNKNFSDLAIIKKLAKLEDDTKSDTKDVDGNDGLKECEGNDKLTNTLLEIRNHYSAENKFNSIIQIFENDDFEQKIIDVLTEKIKQNIPSDQMFNYFDELIVALTDK